MSGTSGGLGRLTPLQFQVLTLAAPRLPPSNPWTLRALRCPVRVRWPERVPTRVLVADDEVEVAARSCGCGGAQRSASTADTR